MKTLIQGSAARQLSKIVSPELKPSDFTIAFSDRVRTERKTDVVANVTLVASLGILLERFASARQFSCDSIGIYRPGYRISYEIQIRSTLSCCSANPICGNKTVICDNNLYVIKREKELSLIAAVAAEMRFPRSDNNYPNLLFSVNCLLFSIGTPVKQGWIPSSYRVCSTTKPRFTHHSHGQLHSRTTSDLTLVEALESSDISALGVTEETEEKVESWCSWQG